MDQMAQVNPGFDRQAYIGAFSGSYRLWGTIVTLMLQALVTSRLVRHSGLHGALLALPLIALGGYTIVAAGVGFSVVRWIKAAENATDYSGMNTAPRPRRLPTSREEKYKATPAIDTCFVRCGDVLSAGVVYVGAQIMHLAVERFAAVDVAFIVLLPAVAFVILGARGLPRRQLAGAAAVIAACCLLATPALAQDSREEQLAAEKAEKAARLQPYEPDRLEQRLEVFNRAMDGPRGLYPFFGSVYPGGAFAVGPGYRLHLGDTSTIDAHAAWSIRNYKGAGANWRLPAFAGDRVELTLHTSWIDAPDVAYYGTGNGSGAPRTGFSFGSTAFGTSARVRTAGPFAVGAGFEALRTESTPLDFNGPLRAISPHFTHPSVFAEFDWRTSPGYTRRGGLYRIAFSDYRQSNGSAYSFQRVDYDVRQLIPFHHESRIIALRALVSTTNTDAGHTVPYALLPDLGGGQRLRGYSSWRFRDNNSLLVSGEYRWSAGSLVDMAVFLDSGKVAARARDLDFNGLTTTYGLGLSIHTPTSTLFRLEVAHTREGMSVGLSVGPSF